MKPNRGMIEMLYRCWHPRRCGGVVEEGVEISMEGIFGVSFSVLTLSSLICWQPQPRRQGITSK